MQSVEEILSGRPFPSTSKAQPRGYKREVDQYAGKCVYERRTAANHDARATTWCTYRKHVKFVEHTELAEHAEHAKHVQHVQHEQHEHAEHVEHDELVKYSQYAQYAEHDEYGNGLCPWCADECDEHRNARHGARQKRTN